MSGARAVRKRHLGGAGSERRSDWEQMCDAPFPMSRDARSHPFWVRPWWALAPMGAGAGWAEPVFCAGGDAVGIFRRLAHKLHLDEEDLAAARAGSRNVHEAPCDGALLERRWRNALAALSRRGAAEAPLGRRLRAPLKALLTCPPPAPLCPPPPSEHTHLGAVAGRARAAGGGGRGPHRPPPAAGPPRKARRPGVGGCWRLACGRAPAAGRALRRRGCGRGDSVHVHSAAIRLAAGPGLPESLRLSGQPGQTNHATQLGRTRAAQATQDNERKPQAAQATSAITARVRAR